MKPSQLERALEVHATWLAQGRPVPPTALLQAHPELAEFLAAMLADPREVDRAIALLDGGLVLGDFRIVEEIGRGGMGVVYRARQRSLDREVALKVLGSHVTRHPDSVARFRREAALAARLDHPNIIAIHAVGNDGDAHWFAMERIDGGALDRIDPATGKPRTLRQTVELCAAVADALAFAHDQGVLHRDVKPSNILVRTDGRPVLTDFGLAREMGDPGITHSGQFAGTPWYASPEQLADSKRVDARADVWSLGATLYELLTGRRPFDGDSAHGVIEQIRTQEPKDPMSLVQDLAPDLAAVVLKALEKAPERRYGSAAAFRDELRAFLEFRPVTARRASRLTMTARWLHRHPGWRTGLLLMAVALFAVPLIVSIAVAGERDRARAAELLARDKAYAANVLAAHTALTAGDGMQAAHLLAGCPEDQRGFEWRVVSAGLDSSVWTGAGPGAAISAIALAGDAELLAAGDGQGNLVVFDTRRGGELWRRPGQGTAIAALAFTAAAQTLILADAAGGLRVHDARDGEQRCRVDAPAGDCAVAIAADASAIVRGTAEARFEVFDARLQRLGEHTLPRVGDRPRTRFVTDGRQLIGATGIGGLARWDLLRPARVATADCDGSFAEFVATPELQRTVTFDARRGFVWWDQGSKDVRHLHHGSRSVAAMALAPDGRQLAAGTQRGEILVFDLDQARLSRVLSGHRAAVLALAAADGGWLASGAADGSLKLWNSHLDAGSGEMAGVAFAASLSGPSFGRSLAVDAQGALFTGGLDGTVRRIDVRDGTVGWQRQLPHWINGLAVLTGDRLLVSYHDAVVHVDAADGTLLGAPTRIQGMAYARRMVADPTGTRCALLDEAGAVTILDPRHGAVVGPRPCVTLSPRSLTGGLTWTHGEGLWVAGEDQFVVHLDATTLAPLARMPVSGAVTAMATDAGTLLVASWDHQRRRGDLARRTLAGGTLADHPLTSQVTALAPMLDRIAVARWDGRLGIHRRSDLEAIVELPQPAPALWNVVAFTPGEWLAIQCYDGEPRVLAADPPTTDLVTARQRAIRAAGGRLAAEALQPTGWSPWAQRRLAARTDLPPKLREQAIAALPPVATWRLLDIATHHGYASERDPRAPSLLLDLRECLHEATPTLNEHDHDAHKIAMALIELRLGHHAAALAALDAMRSPGPEVWHSLRHFVRCMVAAAAGDRTAAVPELAAMRATIGATSEQSLTDLLREAEAVVAAMR